VKKEKGYSVFQCGGGLSYDAREERVSEHLSITI